MFSFFGLFGRSREVQRLDDGLRAAGLHPRLVPDAVKLAAIRFLKAEAGGTRPDQAAQAEAGALLAYCANGPADFRQDNGASASEAVEARIDRAVDVGDSLDARLVMLALHAGLVSPAVIDRFGLETADLAQD